MISKSTVSAICAQIKDEYEAQAGVGGRCATSS
jgi:hypothetical protein